MLPTGGINPDNLYGFVATHCLPSYRILISGVTRKMSGLKNQFWTAPNQLTLLRLIFIPFVITNVLDDNWHWALGLLVLAGLERRARRLAGPRPRSAHFAWPVSRSHRRQAASEFAVPGAVDRSQDPLEIHRAGPQPRRLHTSHLHGAVRHRRTSATSGPASSARSTPFARSLRSSSSCWHRSCNAPAVLILKAFFLYATFAFTLFSGVHYILITGQRLREHNQRLPAS